MPETSSTENASTRSHTSGIMESNACHANTLLITCNILQSEMLIPDKPNQRLGQWQPADSGGVWQCLAHHIPDGGATQASQ